MFYVWNVNTQNFKFLWNNILHMINLKQITYEYIESLKYVNEIKRDLQLKEYSDILALTGPRRVGKTFLLLKKAKELMDNKKQVIYSPFDEPGLKKVSVRQFAELIRKEYPEGKVYLFLDEIQEWEKWDFNLRWMHDMKEFKIYVSGSSSALLSSEIPSKLRGRYISNVLLPISFKEIADFEIKTFREKGRVLKLLEDYMKYGGFPEVWATKSREKILNLLETMFYRDIVERYKIRDIGIFQEIFYFILANFGNTFTWRSLKRLLEGLNVNIDTKTLINYARYMEQSFLIFVINKFSYSAKEQIVSPKKGYIVDTSFMNIFSKPMDIGRRMENIVFLELLRRNNCKVTEINYYATKKNKEIDFVVKEGNKVKQLIEVTYENNRLADKIKNLKAASKELKCRNLLIIAWNKEEVKEGVKIVPLWKWLIS